MSEAETAEIKAVRAVLKEMDPQIILQDHTGYLAEHIKHVIAEARAETAAVVEALQAANEIMQYMGDQLNALDVVSEDDEEYAAPRFEKVEVALANISPAAKAILEQAQRVEEVEQLWELQHRREIEAIQRWREEDPEGRELKMPDYGRLLDWLWAKAHKADEAIELLREHRRLAAMSGCGRNREAIADFLDGLGKEGE